MNYSRRQLEAFGEPFGESATRVKPGGVGRIYGTGGGDGGGGPTTTTVNQSNIPEWLRPQVEGLIGGASQELFDYAVDEDGNYVLQGAKPFVPYSANVQDYVAGFSPLQQQVQANAANLQVPGQFNQATGYANQAAQGGVDSAGRAYGYGNAGFQSGQQGQQMGMQGGDYYGSMGAGYGAQAADVGQMGLRAEQYGRNVSGQAENYARQAANAQQNYAAQATNPAAYQQYMNPYTQNVTDIQIEGLQRQADIARTQRGAQAAKAGAYGGSRQAIENAEANRALQSQMDNVRAQGLQQAYQDAQKNLQYGSNLGLQGLQGAQQGLGTALQGGQLGLSGIGTALEGLQGGMQGAGVGLQGVNTQLAGTAQGMQGAQVGLQGVSGAQAGYGLANQAAGQLGQLGAQQLAAQTDILGLQNQIGGQQQSQEQQMINQGIQNFAQAQENPMQRYNQLNALVRGYAVPGSTTTQYQAAPSLVSQAAGLGMAGYGLSQLSGARKAKGGRIKEKKRPAGLTELALSKMA